MFGWHWRPDHEGYFGQTIRCAIYTRVSTDHGLDQEFNSLNAQYDACLGIYKESGPCRIEPDPVPL